MAGERNWSLGAHPEGVFRPDSELVPVDPTVANGQRHPGLDLFHLLLAMDHGVAAGDGGLLVLNSNPVQDWTQESVTEAAAFQSARHG